MKVLRVSVSPVVACVTLSLCSLLSSGLTAHAASPSAVPDNPRISSPPASDTILIPGPLRSFQRMAGISQEIQPAEVLPRLARKVYMFGYQQGNPTEFLLLID